MSYGRGSLSPVERERIAVILAENCVAPYEDALALVEEVDISYAEHGTDGGGNQHGVVGTLIAMQIDKQIARRQETPDA
jgi:hypothetical protein